MNATFDLDRFVTAQEPVMAQVRQELAAGQKRTHWMWFVFPQIAGLGYSAMARHYAIPSLDDARAYLQHPVLGPRLVELTELVNRVDGRSVQQIFGNPDDMKFHSSMTLFQETQPLFQEAQPLFHEAQPLFHEAQPFFQDNAQRGTEAFQAALDKYFAGSPDRLTLERLKLERLGRR
jgi:uncharacterized protein (DUF1810 family)